MALIKCRECGQIVSDKALKCPKCGYPMNPPTENYSQANHARGMQNYELYKRKKSNRTPLYAIIVALLIGLGFFAWYFIDNGGKEKEVSTNIGSSVGTITETTSNSSSLMEPEQRNEAATTEAALEAIAQSAAKSVEESINPSVSTPVGNQLTLTGILNGDDVIFVLTKTESSHFKGQFYNNTINVSFAVEGNITNNGINLHSVKHGKWRFVATWYGDILQGYATNGDVQYDMELQ